MGSKIKFILILCLLKLTLACGPVHNSAGSNTANSLGEDSAEVFSKTVFPILNNNCATCHDGGTSGPAFAVSDPNISQDTLLNFGLVNSNSPSSSKLISEIEGGHNGIATSIAADLDAAINDWLSQINEIEVNEGNEL